jgi:hypothetical protein
MRDFDKDTEGDSRPLYTRLADAANGRGVIVIGFDTGFAADRASAIADNRHADHCSASDWGPPQPHYLPTLTDSPRYISTARILESALLPGTAFGG